MVELVRLTYSQGTLLLDPAPPGPVGRYFRFDVRVGKYRCLAYRYRDIVSVLRELRVSFRDEVLDLPECPSLNVRGVRLRDYQVEALNSWRSAGMRGVVVLPPGTGKTVIGVKAVELVSGPTLIVVPTLELLDQWVSRVRSLLGVEPGVLGGGVKRVRCVTVSTYDSAYINAEFLGNKFLLLVFDEVHHLPSEGYRQVAELSAAPYRLGLTATPEREDGLHLHLPELVGPVVYRREIPELSGKHLSRFKVVRVWVDLSDDERRRYEELRSKFKGFFDRRRWSLRGLRDFEALIMKSGSDREAREALLAWLEARDIVLNARAKIEKLREILRWHRGDRVLVFTEHNKLVREISRRFLIPEVSYKTSPQERREVMKFFRQGTYSAIVTSKVLEEGVDVPEANVAVILSGSGSRREFIQRLGRVLRPREGKVAIIYEVVAKGTSETFISRRRRRGLEGASSGPLKG